MNATQSTLTPTSIIVPTSYDPLATMTNDMLRAHLQAQRAFLAAELTNPRLTGGDERTIYLLMISKIDNAPSDADREYLLALLRETTALLQRRDSMNSAEAAYDAPPDLSVTERQQAKMKAVRAQRQHRLNWARTEREALNDARSLKASDAEREANLNAVMRILAITDDIGAGELAIAQARTAVVAPITTSTAPELSMLGDDLDNIMSITEPTSIIRPRMRMGS
ncbi:hypothetical protein [Burkholderia glumae]|uniref:hypothetical protein n=1 Tax=Burkholderia glumae TaxID=337 RepID=UPI00215062E6|nr:hypothetical protein [Burkholderia glumae]